MIGSTIGQIVFMPGDMTLVDDGLSRGLIAIYFVVAGRYGSDAAVRQRKSQDRLQGV